MLAQTFSVTGLHCQSCVRAITEAVSSLSGVRAVHIDLQTDGPSTVRIDSDRELGTAEVQAALSEEGDYTVVA